MKKRNILIILLLSLLVIVSSCNNNNLTEETGAKYPEDMTQETPVDTSDVGVEYNSIDYSKYSLTDYSVGILDYSDSAPVSAKYGILTKIYDEELYKDIVPSAEKTIVIDGEEITGSYKLTHNRPNNYYSQYKYMIYDRKGSFAVDDTERIVSYIKYIEIEKTEKAFTDDEYVVIAKDFVEGILGDKEIDWSLFKITVEDGVYQAGYYTISFTKYLNGMQTAESMYVKISYSGVVTTFSSDMLGRIPADLDLSVFESKNAEASVYKRLDEIYSELSKEKRDKYKITYYLPEPVLSVLADGTPCFIYDANVRFTSVDNQYRYTDLVRTMVTPNK